MCDNSSRNIYYQNPDLFKSQSVVDVMVDNLASTLGIGREDLNIVSLKTLEGFRHDWLSGNPLGRCSQGLDIRTDKNYSP